MVDKSRPLVGVLALQGDFARHASSLKAAGARVTRVVRPDDLEACQGLVIPGGESTTLMHLAREGGMVQPLRDFARRGALMGTCAGLIILARNLAGTDMETLALLDIKAERNGFGRQVDSFIDRVDLHIGDQTQNVEGVFIRAPRILAVGQGVSVLAKWRDEPVMVRSGRILALTFHPELTGDARIHKYFVDQLVSGKETSAGAA